MKKEKEYFSCLSHTMSSFFCKLEVIEKKIEREDKLGLLPLYYIMPCGCIERLCNKTKEKGMKVHICNDTNHSRFEFPKRFRLWQYCSVCKKMRVKDLKRTNLVCQKCGSKFKFVHPCD